MSCGLTNEHPDEISPYSPTLIYDTVQLRSWTRVVLQAADCLAEVCNTMSIEIRGSITFTRLPFLGLPSISTCENPLLIAMGEAREENCGKSGRNSCRMHLHFCGNWQLPHQITRRKRYEITRSLAESGIFCVSEDSGSVLICQISKTLRALD